MEVLGTRGRSGSPASTLSTSSVEKTTSAGQQQSLGKSIGRVDDEFGMTGTATAGTTAAEAAGSLSRDSSSTSKSKALLTPSSTASASSCSDRDSSPDLIPSRQAYACPMGSSSTAATVSKTSSPGTSSNTREARNEAQRTASSPQLCEDEPQISAALMAREQKVNPPFSSKGEQSSTDGSPASAVAVGDGAHGQIGRNSQLSVAMDARDDGGWESSSSWGTFGLEFGGDGRDATKAKRKGKKRMRQETQTASTTMTSATASNGATSSQFLWTNSSNPPVSLSPGRVLSNSSASSRASSPNSPSITERLEVLDTLKPPVHQSPHHASQGPLRIQASVPQARSPPPSREVLDLSLGSPIGTEVIDIDTEDSAAAVPPPPRRRNLGSLFYSGLSTAPAWRQSTEGSTFGRRESSSSVVVEEIVMPSRSSTTRNGQSEHGGRGADEAEQAAGRRRKRRQIQDQNGGPARGSSAAETRGSAESGEATSPGPPTRRVRRRAMDNGDHVVAARLQRSESERREQRDMELARQLQSEEDEHIEEHTRALAEALAAPAGGGSSDAFWFHPLGADMDVDGHSWEALDGDDSDDEATDVGLDGEDDGTSDDDGVLIASSSSRGTASSRGVGRGRRGERTSSSVVDVVGGSSDDDDVVPVAGASSSMGDARVGAHAASTRAVGGTAGSSRAFSETRATAGASARRNGGIGASRAAGSGPQSARPFSTRARARAGRGGVGSAAGAVAGRGAYSNMRTSTGAAVARRSGGASALCRSGAGASASSSSRRVGQAPGMTPAAAAADARRRRQQSSANRTSSTSAARRHSISRHPLNAISPLTASAMAVLLERGAGGVPFRARARAGRGGGGRGVAGSAAYFALMSRNLTPADYQQLLALDDATGSGAEARPKGMSAGEIAMLPTQTGNGSGDVEQCCICMDDMKPRQTITRLPACLHTFHSKCISKWLATHASCPIDKTAYNQTKYGDSKQTMSSRPSRASTYDLARITDLRNSMVSCELFSRRG